MPKLINVILKKHSDKIFLSFSNNDKKLWIIPNKNTRTALNLYQPSALKGKLLKLCLPYMKNSKIVQKYLSITAEKYILESSLLELLKTVFNTDTFEFAVFGGTPSNHQKITIQIFKGNKILGYCKVTNDKDVKALFKHEKKILRELNGSGLHQIPLCLYSGDLNDEQAVFVQSTIKTNNSKVVHSWKIKHWEFLSTLKKQTEQTLLFTQTDYFKTLQILKKNSSYLSDRDAQIIEKAILRVTQFYDNKSACFSAYHADFTPWNMFVEKGELFVFDFEYAKMTYPPMLDWFHFFTQTSIFEKGWDDDQIFNHFNSNKNKIKKHIDHPEFFYLCYLLDIVTLYITRDKGGYSKDVKHNLSIWINLISRL